MTTVSIKTDPEDDWAQGRNGLIKMATAQFRISPPSQGNNENWLPAYLVIDALNKRGDVCNAGLGFTLTPEVVEGLKQVVKAAEAALKE